MQNWLKRERESAKGPTIVGQCVFYAPLGLGLGLGLGVLFLYRLGLGLG